MIRHRPRRTAQSLCVHIERLEHRRLLAGDLELVRDINPGAGSSQSSFPNFVTVGSHLFFVANDGVNGAELWKSDGTEAGTTLVKDIRSGPSGGDVRYLTNVEGTLYFRANDGVNGPEIWKTDGSTMGTVRLTGMSNITDIFPHSLTDVGGVLYFAGFDNAGGELWKSDGTQAGTNRVRDIRPGSSSSNPRNLTEVAGALFFTADDGTTGYELWKSNGTQGGTVRVRDVRSGYFGSSPAGLTNVGGTLFFSALLQGDTFFSPEVEELWKSDGTLAGTTSVKRVKGDGRSYSDGLTNVQGTLFFQAEDFFNDDELWKSDGTGVGTTRVKEIRAGSGGSTPLGLVDVSGVLFFTANDGASGHELWKSDGTAIGTSRVKDINPGPSTSNAGSLTNVGGTLYFRATSGFGVAELWKSDGSEAGTVPVRLPGQIPLVNPRAIAFAGNRVFIAGTRPDVGSELFSLDLSDLLVTGDYDQSGAVDDLDRAFWAANYGATAGVGLQADGNGDGVVDAADYTVWRDNLGATLPALASEAPKEVTSASEAIDAAIELLVESAFAAAPILLPAPVVASNSARPVATSLRPHFAAPRRDDLLLVRGEQAEPIRAVVKLADNSDASAATQPSIDPQTAPQGRAVRPKFAPMVRR